MQLNINVANKIATLTNADTKIICNNSDYTVAFTFDDEWAGYSEKTARFVWNGKYEDVKFTGDTCAVPVVCGTNMLYIGVYAGDICTTTSACVPCLRSILDMTEEAQPEYMEPFAEQAIEAASRAEAAAATAATEATKAAEDEVERLVGELGVVQTTGDSKNAVMSQDASTRVFDRLSSGLFPSGILHRGLMDVMASESVVLMSSTDDTYLLTAGNYVYLTVKTNSFLKKRVYLEFKDGEKNVLSQRGIDTRSSAFCVALKVPSGAVVMNAGINNLSSDAVNVEWYVSRTRPKNELYGRRIVAIGDSITSGTNNDDSSYIDIVAKNNDCQIINYAKSGATLVQTGTRACIGSMIDTAIAEGNADADFLVISGGYNDSQNSINNPVGTFDNTNYGGQYDTTTICGALETIFYKAKNSFGIVHKTRGVHYPKVIFMLDYLYPSQTPWTENRETIKKLCEKWGISCYDMSELSGLINHSDLNFKNTVFTDNVHPNEEGYQMIAKWLEKKLG